MEDFIMRLTAPKTVVFFISVILIIVGLVVYLTTLSFFPGDAYWLTFAGGALLSLACLLKGL
jgi:membrane protein YdbS with pleckstrin-like domain